ncbi:hypothetical protein D3C86_1924960 [compost metagenome]
MEKFFPYRVDMFHKLIAGYDVINAIGDAHKSFGPARFRARFLSTLEVYVLDTLEHADFYSVGGSWFMVQHEFYFKNRDDAVLFKLRHG